jgi:hypothetical protein
MATIDRSEIIRGPAVLQYSTETFYSKGDVVVTVEQTTFDKESDVFGIIGRAVTDRQVKIRFTPVGEIEALTVLYPYGDASDYPIGSSVFGAADFALTITGSLNKLIVHNCAITQMPSLTLGAGTTAFGECEMTGLIKRDAEPNLAASYWAYTESTNALPDAMDAAIVLAAQYQATYMGLTVHPVNAFTVDFDMTLSPVIADGTGTIDMRLQDLQFSTSWEPLAQAAAVPADTLGYLANGIGAEVFSGALTIATATSGGISFAADKACLTNIDILWSTTNNLNGPMTVVSKRDINAGALDNLFTVSVV